MANVTITLNTGQPQPQPMGGQGYYQPGMQPTTGNPFAPQPMNPYTQPQPYVQPQPQPMMMQQPNPMIQQQAMINQQNMMNQQLVQQNMQLQNALIKQQMNQKVPQSGWDRLQARDGIFIKQKFDWEENLTGCEQPNTYYVYGLSKDGEAKGNMLFRCQEKSNCCARTCLSGECRPFQVTVQTVDKEFEQLDKEPFLKIDRPCKCTCYCFSRPEITVTCVLNGGNEFVGKVIDPCQCANIVLNVYNNNHSMAYIIDGSCCQLGIWCKFPCEPCQNIEFKIKGADGMELSTIKKKSPGCLVSQISDADNFALTFPQGCTKEDKAILMAAVLFLDFRHFEENGGKKQEGTNVIVVGGNE